VSCWRCQYLAVRKFATAPSPHFEPTVLKVRQQGSAGTDESTRSNVLIRLSVTCIQKYMPVRNYNNNCWSTCTLTFGRAGWPEEKYILKTRVLHRTYLTHYTLTIHMFSSIDKLEVWLLQLFSYTIAHGTLDYLIGICPCQATTHRHENTQDPRSKQPCPSKSIMVRLSCWFTLVLPTSSRRSLRSQQMTSRSSIALNHCCCR
jgi:hypothetical protein